MYKHKIESITITMDNNSLLKLLDSKLAEVLLLIIRQSNTNTYQWISSKGNRTEIQNRLTLSTPTISRYIASLKEKGILLQGEFSARGEYSINKKLIKL